MMSIISVDGLDWQVLSKLIPKSQYFQISFVKSCFVTCTDAAYQRHTYERDGVGRGRHDLSDQQHEDGQRQQDGDTCGDTD